MTDEEVAKVKNRYDELMLNYLSSPPSDRMRLYNQYFKEVYSYNHKDNYDLDIMTVDEFTKTDNITFTYDKETNTAKLILKGIFNYL